MKSLRQVCSLAQQVKTPSPLGRWTLPRAIGSSLLPHLMSLLPVALYFEYVLVFSYGCNIDPSIVTCRLLQNRLIPA